MAESFVASLDCRLSDSALLCGHDHARGSGVALSFDIDDWCNPYRRHSAIGHRPDVARTAGEAGRFPQTGPAHSDWDSSAPPTVVATGGPGRGPGGFRRWATFGGTTGTWWLDQRFERLQGDVHTPRHTPHVRSEPHARGPDPAAKPLRLHPDRDAAMALSLPGAASGRPRLASFREDTSHSTIESTRFAGERRSPQRSTSACPQAEDA